MSHHVVVNMDHEAWQAGYAAGLEGRSSINPPERFNVIPSRNKLEHPMPLRTLFSKLLDRSKATDSDALPDGLLALDSDLAVHAEAQGLNFYTAMQAHQSWKRRLIQYAQGEANAPIDIEQLRCDTCCELGDWLHNRAQVPRRYFGVFERLIEDHAQFHRVAADVALQAQRGQREQALQAITRGEFAKQSAKVVGTLSEMFLALTETDTRT